VLGTSTRPLRPGRPRPSAAGTVCLPGGGDPVLLLYRPAAVGLLDARLGYVYPTKPVGLADIYRWSTCCLMTAILSRSAHPGTETPRAILSRAKVLHPLSAMDFGERSSSAAWGVDEKHANTHVSAAASRRCYHPSNPRSAAHGRHRPGRRGMLVRVVFCFGGYTLVRRSYFRYKAQDVMLLIFLTYQVSGLT